MNPYVRLFVGGFGLLWMLVSAALYFSGLPADVDPRPAMKYGAVAAVIIGAAITIVGLVVHWIVNG